MKDGLAHDHFFHVGIITEASRYKFLLFLQFRKRRIWIEERRGKQRIIDIEYVLCTGSGSKVKF